MDKMQETYLPFTRDQVRKYFSQNADKHLEYYEKSIVNYQIYLSDPGRTPKRSFRWLRQIEKDERFWISQVLITIFEQPMYQLKADLKKLLEICFKEFPLAAFNSWDDALGDDLKLRFEENLPSPEEYKKMLSDDLGERHIVPYVLESGRNPQDPSKFHTNLEGATDVDALITSKATGLCILIEAKVLSDISYQVSYDIYRNQIARNVDVMLSEKSGKSLFILLTPQQFKDNRHTRLYGYKMESYKANPQELADDLAHRKDVSDWSAIVKRMGWLTWHDIHHVHNACCPWVVQKPQ